MPVLASNAELFLIVVFLFELDLSELIIFKIF